MAISIPQVDDPFEISFITPNGISINLNDKVNTSLIVGLMGDLMPEFDYQEEFAPQIEGSIITAVKAKPRIFSFPIVIFDTSKEAVINRVAGLSKSMDPRLGDGYIKVKHGSNYRILYCRLISGLNSDGIAENQFTDYVKSVLVFKASDPYYYDFTPTLIQVDGDFSPSNFFPILPVQFSSDTTFVTSNINNSGDLDSWAIFTITGSGTRFVITNLTTGKYIDINTTLAGGETITIDCRPRTRSVKDGSGNNVFHYMTPTSKIFPIVPGTNLLKFEIYGGDENSSIVLSYRNSYLTR